MDVKMPPTFSTEGIRAAHAIKRQWPRIGGVVLTQHDAEDYIWALLAEGVEGYGYPHEVRVGDVDQLVRAIRELATGGSVLDPRIVQTLVRARSSCACGTMPSMGSPNAFEPRTALLPGPQRRVFRDLGSVPRRFVLYGGTAIMLRLGHRPSLDFDFFSNDPFLPDALEREISLLRGSIRSRSEPGTLVCVVDRAGPVTVSFFGGLPLRRVGNPDRAGSGGPLTASLLDLAATKVKVVQDRAEGKDYVDVARLLREGISLRDALAAALAVYGPTFNPLLSLKALSYFGDGDLPSLGTEIRETLTRAVRETALEAIRPATPLPGGLTGEDL